MRYLAIDEFAVQKGHKYKTVVMDLETGEVIFVGNGLAEATLGPSAKSLKTAGVRPEAIAMDMWVPYISWAARHFPDALIVFDHFHIVKNLNEAISDAHQALYQLETDLNKRSVLKGTRWLLLKNRDNLSEEKDEAKGLQEALQVNQPLAAAYHLRLTFGISSMKNIAWTLAFPLLSTCSVSILPFVPNCRYSPQPETPFGVMVIRCMVMYQYCRSTLVNAECAIFRRCQRVQCRI